MKNDTTETGCATYILYALMLVIGLYAIGSFMWFVMANLIRYMAQYGEAGTSAAILACGAMAGGLLGALVGYFGRSRK